MTSPVLERLEREFGFGRDQVRDCPFLLVGEPQEVIEKVLSLRERFGVTYLALLDPQTTGFESVLPLLV